MKSRVLILLLAFLYVYILFNRFDDWKNRTYQWDKMGYHSYLPAVFIYDDLGSLSFYPEIAQKYHFTADVERYALFDIIPGKSLNKYTIGCAIMESPFFFLAHEYTKISEKYPADGFSIPYQVGTALANIFWVVLGLFFVRKFLLYHFTDNIVTITLLCIGLGTNLYNYTAFDHGMSHPYSFSLFAMSLYACHQWFNNNNTKYAYLLALAIGMVIIVRPVNIILGILPLLWNVSGINSFKQHISQIFQDRKAILFSTIIFAAILFIQMLYWKYTTNQWLFYSYQGEVFHFAHPQIIKGLFGYQKGWFVYTPIALLGIIGIFFLQKPYKLAFFISFSVFIYITFSWKTWWYGGSFGCRPLIETLAVIAFPLTVLINKIYTLKRKFIKAGFTIILLCFIALNMFQTYQFSLMVLHYERMSKAYYWKTFGKIKHTEDMQPYLTPTDEFIFDE